MKKLYIFGNGLGRSIDNRYFDLQRALEKAWGPDGPLSEDQRDLIRACLDDEIIESESGAPKEEEQLRDLQRVVDACDLIMNFQERASSSDAWLTKTGLEFPTAVRRYFHHAASQFHTENIRLPEDFSKSLRKFVKSERPHIATLNYDDLLYEAFTDTSIFSEHMLRDGFFKKFAIEQHKNYFDSRQEGWFLHLHGSPLFISRNNQDIKLRRSELSSFKGNERTHLVLTNAKSKPAAIKSSEVLSGYWKILESILTNKVEVTLFGYGGGDLHLNTLIGQSTECVVRIVNRRSKDEAKAKRRWTRLLNGKKILDENFFFVDRVTNFRQW